MNIKRLLFLVLTILNSSSWADDAVEAAITGNIIFEKAPELIMQDETLIISKSAGKNLGDDNFSIDVDFHFKNISNHDVIRKIAFVLPPVQCRMDVNSMWRGLDSSDNNEIHNKGLKDFTITVNGQPQSYITRTQASLNKRNITDLLIKLQIPLNPCKIQTTMDGRPDPKYDIALKKYQLLTATNDAAWSENIYFEWTQNFSAGKTINIHHHYTPVIGESVLSSRTIDELNEMFTRNTPSQIPIWNRPPTTLVQSNPSIVYPKTDLGADNNQKRFCVMPKWIQYHLTTGANWNGGIGIFKLIIKDDADTPFAVNTFYNPDNNANISMYGNTMSFVIKKFIPAKDLFILFLSRPQSVEDLQVCGI